MPAFISPLLFLHTFSGILAIFEQKPMGFLSPLRRGSPNMTLNDDWKRELL